MRKQSEIAFRAFAHKAKYGCAYGASSGINHKKFFYFRSHSNWGWIPQSLKEFRPLKPWPHLALWGSALDMNEIYRILSLPPIFQPMSFIYELIHQDLTDSGPSHGHISPKKIFRETLPGALENPRRPSWPPQGTPPTHPYVQLTSVLFIIIPIFSHFSHFDVAQLAPNPGQEVQAPCNEYISRLPSFSPLTSSDIPASIITPMPLT